MNVRLTQIDGKVHKKSGPTPNLALMKLSSWHKAQGDSVFFTRHTKSQPEEPAYQIVYGSAIFGHSKPAMTTFVESWPEAVVGGTGFNLTATVEKIIGSEWEKYDYSHYPGFVSSIGFSQRGCRLRCGFCVVPAKEGRPRSVNTIHQIWRGEGHPKQIVLLDNDFFGQPREEWRARIEEIKAGRFKVCFNQGLNVRLLDDESCRALATVKYYDDQFSHRQLYTAWDNLKDEGVFFRGIDMLERAGVPPRHVMAYMLIGYDPEETWERILYRFEKMKARGILVYPMVYNNQDKDKKRFQRWVVRRYHKFIPWDKFTNETRREYERAKKK